MLAERRQAIISEVEAFDSGLRAGKKILDAIASEVSYEFSTYDRSMRRTYSKCLTDLIADSLTQYRANMDETQQLKLATTCLEWINVARARNLIHDRDEEFQRLKLANSDLEAKLLQVEAELKKCKQQFADYRDIVHPSDKKTQTGDVR